MYGPNAIFSDRSGLWRRRGALEDVVDAQRKLARLERLCDVIVGTDLQALDARFGFVPAPSASRSAPRTRSG